MANLVALCRIDGTFHIKRVNLSQGVQAKIGAVFEEQARAFLKGVDEEVVFGTDWKPDEDQILVMDAPAEAAAVTDALKQPLALDTVGKNSFGEIVGLATAAGNGETSRVLIQRFGLQQLLSRRVLTLMLSGDTYDELSASAFTIAGGLAAIVEGPKLKFKSFHTVKGIFLLNEYYQEATDQQIDAFCSSESFAEMDAGPFKSKCDLSMRKIIHAVIKSDVLSQYSTEDIVKKENTFKLKIESREGKIMMPSDKKSIKRFLRFLDDGIYEAPLSALMYESNSRRLLNA